MKSKNKDVQSFLDELQETDNSKYEILQTARKKVFDTFSSIEERIMYGGIMFTDQEDFGGLFVSKKHVSFEFGKGHLLDDPKKYLEGTGKYRRHLKLVRIEDIQEKEVLSFLQQLV